MADSTLDSELFILFDRWPGIPSFFADKKEDGPPGGFLGVTHNNVTIPAYQPGIKWQILNASADGGQPGYATMIYLQANTQVGLAAKDFCVGDSATQFWVVTDGPDVSVVSTGAALIAVAISAITDASYAWFWCGGVCPEGWVAALGGDYLTKDAQVAGLVCLANMTADSMGIGAVAADTSAGIGFALAADAA